MTRKHFKAAADIVRFSDHLPLNERQAMAKAFMVLFAQFNPKFDRSKFVAACGL